MCEVFERFKHPPVNVSNLYAFDAPERPTVISFLADFWCVKWKQTASLLKESAARVITAPHHYKKQELSFSLCSEFI